MSLIAIILVLVLEQFHALSVTRVIHAPFLRLADRVMAYFDDGEYRQGISAWILLVAIPSCAVLLLSFVLQFNAPVWGFVLGLAVLYLTMGLRHFSNQFTAIQTALQFGEIERARSLLAVWRGRSGDHLTPTETAGHSIARGLTDAHQHVFAPIFWFAVVGPSGALMYRLAQLLDERWGQQWKARMADGSGRYAGRFGEFSGKAFLLIDWIPARLTSIAFALVGDFEDAIQCWRTQLNQSPRSYQEIVVASGAGALGVRIAVATTTPLGPDADDTGVAEFGLGDDADSNGMQRAAAMVWRALLLVLLVLAVSLLSSWQSFF